MNLDEKIQCVAEKVKFKNAERYKSRTGFVFKGIDFHNKNVLEVGCGRGAFALWAGLHGAGYVLGIEPETAGSSSGVLTTLQETIQHLGFGDIVEAKNLYLSEVKPESKQYDIVIMYNVINHINEEFVQKLHYDEDARKFYIDTFKYVHKLMKKNGYLIIGDCSRHNFWNKIGLKSPVAAMIEWHKHQPPKIWKDILQKAGFDYYDLRWSPLNPFRRLTANRWIQYFTTSHFVIRFRRN